MAYPTAVNNQITDAITQVNLLNIGLAPGQSEGLLYQATAAALSQAAHNATNAANQSSILFQSVTTTCSAIIAKLAP